MNSDNINTTYCLGCRKAMAALTTFCPLCGHDQRKPKRAETPTEPATAMGNSAPTVTHPYSRVAPLSSSPPPKSARTPAYKATYVYGVKLIEPHPYSVGLFFWTIACVVFGLFGTLSSLLWGPLALIMVPGSWFVTVGIYFWGKCKWNL